MSRVLTLFGLILVLAAGVSLYQLKYQVEEREARLFELHRQMAQDGEAIRVLNAEWALLSSPARLQEPGETYLKLRRTEADQILVSLADLPFRSPVEGPKLAASYEQDSLSPLAKIGAPLPRRKPAFARRAPPSRPAADRATTARAVAERTKTESDTEKSELTTAARLAEAVRRVSGNRDQ